MQKNAVIDHMRLDGGVLCLDFVNTVPNRKAADGRDNLNGARDLAYWAKKANVIESSALGAMEKTFASSPKKSEDFFSEALRLRHLIYSIFKPISQHQKVKAADLEEFNKITTHYFPMLTLSHHKDGFVQKWKFDHGHPNSITAAILKSAHDLLLSEKLSRIKECPNCGWLFLDGTKNGKRRWCSMQDCGSNVKSLKYYYRKKKEESK